MNKEKQIKAEKAVDKMLGVNRIYITFQKPLILGEGDRVNISGRMGKDGEIVTGSIQISRDFENPPYAGFGYPMNSPTIPPQMGTQTPSNPTKRIGGRGGA